MPGRSTGLGRGIDALLPRGVQRVLELPRDVIRPNRLQPRERVHEGGLKELADSIRLYGILQPVVVAERDEDGMYELVAGERRWRAAGLAGLTVVPGSGEIGRGAGAVAAGVGGEFTESEPVGGREGAGVPAVTGGI